jgi:hypothetical protein
MFTTQSCRQQAAVIQDHENTDICNKTLQKTEKTNLIIKYNKDQQDALFTFSFIPINNLYMHSRSLRVASGATAPGPALEGAPRFRPKVVLMSLSSYILW